MAGAVRTGVAAIAGALSLSEQVVGTALRVPAEVVMVAAASMGLVVLPGTGWVVAAIAGGLRWDGAGGRVPML